MRVKLVDRIDQCSAWAHPTCIHAYGARSSSLLPSSPDWYTAPREPLLSCPPRPHAGGCTWRRRANRHTTPSCPEDWPRCDAPLPPPPVPHALPCALVCSRSYNSCRDLSQRPCRRGARECPPRRVYSSTQPRCLTTGVPSCPWLTSRGGAAPATRPSLVGLAALGARDTAATACVRADGSL